MSISSSLVIGVSVIGGFLATLNHSLPQTDSDDAASPAALSSQAEKEASGPSVLSEKGGAADSMAVFMDMRAELAIAKSRAHELTSYTAILEMQEEVNGSLREMNNIQFKFRQEPFSVYMRWTANGKEALFVRGRNDDRLLAKPANGLAALKRLWRLDPDSRMAKQSCRYPITESGIENLVNRVDQFYAGRSDWSAAVNCSVTKSSQAGRSVTKYSMLFRDESVSPEYLKSQLCFDQATGLLTDVRNFGWTDDKSPRIIEHYAYSEIDLSAILNDNDFDEKNSEYEFVAR